ncbi:hypothetical protein BJ508DRAFT_411967 [Ascobolus immersus RN42]|uniref:CENP-V/GFA domain-containing protein n=1 Tax=Ascobolus immersus RN42 TaxID=1160509 RepID=A0A3N4IHF3_ASCIM|nr:hypothetical protein BJ508DRAFT_411967 [Ascobolus immersus RN42]
MAPFSIACDCRSCVITLEGDFHSHFTFINADAPAYFCTCATCRLGTGFMSTLLVRVPTSWVTASPNNLSFGTYTEPDNEAPSASTSSINVLLEDNEDRDRIRKAKHGTKHFCSKCGAGLFYDVPKGFEGSKKLDADEQEVEIFLPALRLDDNLPYSAHCTLDKLAELPEKPDLEGPIKEIITKLLYPASTVVNPGPTTVDPAQSDDDKDDREREREEDACLEGGCLCGSVSIKIRRAPKNYKDDPVLREWVYPHPGDDNILRIGGGICHCNSCRTIASTPFFSWLFVPTKLLTLTSTGDSIKTYNSSQGVTRRFCGTCGAQLSFAKRDDMWDIASSLMDLGEMKKGEWVRWSFKEEGRRLGRLTDGEEYIEGWFEGRGSYEDDGREWWPGLVDVVKSAVAEVLWKEV